MGKRNLIPKNALFFLLVPALVTACTVSDRSALPTTPEKTEPTPATQKIPKAPPAPGEVALGTLTPYFEHINNGDAATALNEDRLADAIAAFDTVAASGADTALRDRARFLSAYLSYYAGDAARAYTELPAMTSSLPLLADVIYEVTALSAFRLNKYDECITFAEQMTHSRAQAAMLIGDAHLQQDQFEDALRQYRLVLDQWPGYAKAECQAKIIACITALTDDYDLKQTEAHHAANDQSNEDSDADVDPVSADTKGDTPADTDAGEADTESATVMYDTADTDTADAAELANLVSEKLQITPADPNEYMRALIDEALTLMNTMEAQAPGGKWTREALEHEETLLGRIGKKIPKQKKETRVAENLYEDARELMLKRRHDKALKAYQKVLKFAKRGGALECQARYEEAIVTSFKREHGKAADLFTDVAADCRMPEIRLKALYKAGKSNMSANRYREAIDMFAQVEKLFPTHSYADDARLHAARCWLALGNEERFLSMVSSLPDDYPSGDMRAEALWVGAKRALDSDNLEKAEEILEKYYHMFPIEKGWYTAGRAGYWYGRVLELLEKTDDALARYEYVISTTPFSFYMVLAYSRLMELDGTRAELLTAELAPGGGTEKNTIEETLLTDGPFASGVELIRLGLTTRGTKLIKSVLSRPDTPPSVHRAAAALFRQVGSFTDAKEVSTSMNDGWKNRYPTGDDYTAWTLAFPKAFDSEVAFASTESGIEKSLIFAIMREESGFNHKIESWANAMGLMQLILPTAKSMGKGLGIQVTKKSLNDPQTNVRLGAAYLSYLGGMFENHPALIVPGYNAGGGAVARWLKERGDQPLDLWVESIPYEQTRGYTKRVLATYATYKFLYDKDRPFLTLDFNLNR
ncbi:MAG: transglycosylase SLT domain-containing protein [Deltaproteobacteria bacterium]|nr:transglycosylase SLT domain-containing protein [Deltaproteobacteria bacterium]MBN2673475.1 transglycosylase SLT domain-containing protein [Deltaproteobacteria bacterium]